MSSSTINVNLAFTANTEAAAQQIENLQERIANLKMAASQPGKMSGITDSLVEASKVATQLQMTLSSAMNSKTGRLDLSKFASSMKASGMSLQKYKDSLSALGPAGNQAFAQLAKSLSTAEVPMRKTSAWANDLFVSLKNTAKWQLSSSLLHGFMGTVQQAYGYAKDLNHSLNDIRIVTGQDTTQMAKFAIEANKSAKALSSTTTEYTKASLIYYQQGLSDKEVKDRTDITIKMANATGTSAQVVSDQMTAVWNNFAKGGDNLEHYADVMTALGAATASSTDEIATGLQKFAAIGDMIGLSYEYAAASLATVTATTRQSAEVVGTAFKTIFARIQGLKLGETLDDGTTLNKYSAALDKVGINIKDQNGELKDMDTILDEMGGKWKGFSKDQQVALAQTVAGTRQYNQLVALMDNWDYFKENLNVANASDGTLQSQADIYAESWAAASDRVRASAEGIYDSLLNDKFFIKFNNFIADLLTGTEKLVDNMGGFKGVLIALGSVAANVFQKQIMEGFRNVAYTFSPKAQQRYLDNLRTNANDMLTNTYGKGSIQSKMYAEQAMSQQALIDNAGHMTEGQQQLYAAMLDQQSYMANKVIQQQEASENFEKEANKSIRVTGYKAQGYVGKKNQNISMTKSREQFTTQAKNYQEQITQDLQFKRLLDSTSDLQKGPKATPEEIKQFVKMINDSQGFNKNNFLKSLNSKQDRNKYSNLLDGKFNSTKNGLANDFDDMVAQLSKYSSGLVSNAGKKLAKTMSRNMPGMSSEQQADFIRKLHEQTEGAVLSKFQAEEGSKQVKTFAQGLQKDMGEQYTQMSRGEKAMAFSSSLGSVATMIQGAKTAMQALGDTGASAGERVASGFMGASMVMSSLLNAMRGMNKAMLDSVGTSVLMSKGVTKALGKIGVAQKSIDAASSTTRAMVGGGALLAASLAIMGIVKGFQILSKWQKEASGEGQLKRMQSSAAALKNELSSVQAEASNIKQAFTDFDDISSKLQNCKIGTQEWRDALQSTGKAAQNLLQKLPPEFLEQWQQSHVGESLYTQDESGKITFHKDLEEDVNEYMSNREKAVASASNTLNNEVLLQEANYAKEHSAKMMSLYGMGDKGIDEANQLFEKMASDMRETPMTYEEFSKAYSNLFNPELLSQDEIESQLHSLYKDVGDYNSKKYNQYALASNLTTDLAAGEFAAEHHYSEDKKNALKGTYEMDKKAGEAEINDYLQDIGVTTRKNDAEAQRLLGALKGVGLDYEMAEGNAVTGTAGSRVFKLGHMVDGEMVYEDIGEAGLRAMYSAAYAQQQLGFEDNEGFKDFTAEDWEKAAKIGDNYNAAEGKFDLTEFLASELGTKENLNELSFDGLDDSAKKVLTAYGITESNFADYAADAIGSLQATQKDINSFSSSQGTKIVNLTERFSNLSNAGYVTNQIQGLEDKYKDNFSLESTSDFINHNMKNEEGLVDFFEALKDVELGAEGAEGKIRSLAEEFGLTDIESFLLAIKNVPETFDTSTDHISADQKRIEEIFGKDGPKLGSVIDESAKGELEQMGIATDGFFTKMADGTYQLTNRVEEFEQATAEHGLDEYLEALNNFNQAKKEQIENGVRAGQLTSDMANIKVSTVGTTGGEGTLSDFDQDRINYLQSFGKDAFGDVDSDLVNKIFDIDTDKLTGNETYDLSVFQAIADMLGSVENQQQLTENSAVASMESSDQMFSGGVSQDTYAEQSDLMLQKDASVNNFDYETLKAYRETLRETNEDLADNEFALNQMAVASMKLDRGIANLEKNWKKFNKVLNDPKADLTEKTEAYQEIENILGDILDVDPKKFSKGFKESEETLSQLGKIAQGDSEAFNDLQESATFDFLDNLGVDDATLAALKDDIQQLADAQVAAGEQISDMPEVDGTQMLESLNAIYQEAVMSTLEAGGSMADALQAGNDAIQAAGWEVPEFDPQVGTVGVDGTYPEGVEVSAGATVMGGLDDTQKATELIVTDKGEGQIHAEIPRITNATKGAEHAGSGGGGGGGGGAKKPKKIKKTKKDASSRYHHVNNLIADKERTMKNYKATADTLYGKDRIAGMEAENKELQKSVDLYKQKLAAAKDYLKIDQAEVDKFGYGAIYDEAGNIVNYEEILDKALKELNAAEDHFNSLSADAQNDYQETLNDAKDKFKDFQDALKQYEETDKLIEDLEDKMAEAKRQWQEKNYEVLEYKLELKLDLHEQDLKKIEYLLDKTSEDFYDAAENLVHLTEKIGNTSEALNIYKVQVEDLQKAFEKGDISEKDYIEGLKDAHSEILDNLSTMNELDDQMKHFYGETLEKGAEELSKYTDKMNNLTNALSHYKDILSLLGREEDFDSIGTILQGQADISKNQFDVLQRNFESLNKQKEEAYQKLLNSTDAAEKEILQQQYDDIEKMTAEAYDNMLSKAQEYAENLQAILENSRNKAYKDLERNLTQGTSFDELLTNLEHAKSRQEEYLTETNKIYETNKLINKAQRDMDKTTNEAAKRRLQAYMDETAELQKQGELSNFELEIQKAKYEILLAENALEEAKMAKSKVRLTRDDEGNFSYTYTADQDALDEAQQELEDKRNALYNIYLNGSYDYTEKSIQARQEMADALKEIDDNDLLAAEEKERRKAEIRQHYNDQLISYQEFYNIAMEGLGDQAVDSWANDFDIMREDAEVWQSSMDQYLIECEQAFAKWQIEIEKITKDVGLSYNDLINKTKNITSSSTELKDEVINNVIPAIEKENEAVKKLTEVYAAQRKELQGMIEDYEKVIDGINGMIQAQQEQEGQYEDSNSGDISYKPNADTNNTVSSNPNFYPSEGGGGGGGSGGNKPKNPYGSNHYVETGQERHDKAPEPPPPKKTISQTIADTINGWGQKLNQALGLPVGRVSLDTGGYTGEWGPDGRWAVLHQKELVLNAHDTENFLQALELTRSFARTLEVQAAQMQTGLTSLLTPGTVRPEADTLQQEVTIHAEFPNVQNSNEIEEAFSNLVNQASQYANRKN